MLGVVVMGRPPDRGQNLAMGDNPPGIAGKHREKGVFLGRQPQRPARTRDKLFVKVDHQIAGLDPGDFALLAHGMAGCRPKACLQFADTKWFFQIVVGPQIKGRHLFGLAVPRGQNDDRHLGEGPDVLQHVFAVPVRQAKVEQDGIRRDAGGQPHGFVAGQGGAGFITRTFQPDAQHRLNLRVVIHDQNAPDAHVAAPSSRGSSAAGRRTIRRVPRRRAAGLSA